MREDCEQGENITVAFTMSSAISRVVTRFPIANLTHDWVSDFKTRENGPGTAEGRGSRPALASTTWRPSRSKPPADAVLLPLETNDLR